MWIRTTLLLITVAACGIGCKYNDIELLGDGGGTCTKCPALPDLAPPSPKCAAAKGLSGDNLICIDFMSIPDQILPDPPTAGSLSGWSFNTPPNCWQIMSGKLQVMDFKNFMGSCGFLMKALLPSDYQKYNSFTLAIVQTLDFNETQQRAQIMLGQDDPPTRLIDQATGKQPRQQRTYQIAKAALPNGGNGYQPLFKITSTVGPGGGYTGWLIESIAVNGVQ